MPMVDALFVILSIFFVAFIVLSAPKEAKPDNRVPQPISIPTDQYFEIDSFQLSDHNRRNLRRFLFDSLLDKYELLVKENQLDQLKFIIIEGHADKQPRRTSYYSDITKINPKVDGNEELSYFRAYTVYREVADIFNTLSIFNESDSDFNGSMIVAGAGSRNIKCETVNRCKNNGEINDIVIVSGEESRVDGCKRYFRCQQNGEFTYHAAPEDGDPRNVPRNRRIEIHFIFDKDSGEDHAE